MEVDEDLASEDGDDAMSFRVLVEPEEDDDDEAGEDKAEDGGSCCSCCYSTKPLFSEIDGVSRPKGPGLYVSTPAVIESQASPNPSPSLSF